MVVKQCYDDFANGNIPTLLGRLSEDVEWSNPGYPDLPYAGKKKGKAEVNKFFAKLDQALEFTHFEPKTFISDGDEVVVFGNAKGKARETGKIFDSDWVMLWTVKDGKVKRYQTYIDTNALAKALKW